MPAGTLALDGMTLVAGMPRAEALVAQVTADPLAGVTAGVLSPGGCGKTVLLDSLRDVYRAAGVDVLGREALTQPVERPSATTVLMLDDAHALSAAELSRAHELIRIGTSTVLAFRPWPRTPELIDAATLVRRFGPLLVLGYLEPGQTARRAAAHRGTLPSADLVAYLQRVTAGHPVLVDLVLDVLADEAGGDRAPAGTTRSMVDRAEHLLPALDDVCVRLLHAVAVGADLDTEVLSGLLEVPGESVREIVDRARATGLLLGSGGVAPLIGQALRSAVPKDVTARVQSSLLSLQHDRGRDVVDLATTMVSAGTRGNRLASVLVNAANRELSIDPRRSLELYEQAIAAGTEPSAVAVRRAYASALVGEFDAAARLTDSVLADAESTDLAAAVDVSATVAAHRGDLGRAAELYSWLGPHRMQGGAAFAVLAMIGTGGRESAARMMGTLDQTTAPTAVASATRAMAAGVWESVTGSPSVALATLGRGAALFESSASRAVLLPDSPSALTALLAIHCGHLDTAEWAVTRAADLGLGGPTLRTRHLLLRGWVAMLQGSYQQARTWRDAAAAGLGPAGWAAASPRDQLLRWGLDIGVARRTSDVRGLVSTWSQIREVVLRHPVDLYSLLPVAEFAIAAARLRESERMSGMLDEARALLAGLGDPITWSAPLHWAGVQAGVLLDSPATLKEHAEALVAASRTHAVAGAMATATKGWVDVLGRKTDVDQLQRAARGLAGIGLAWDASRLLAQAAARTSDRRAATVLLQAARAMVGGTDANPTAAPAADGELSDPNTSEPAQAARPAAVGRLGLSERELEVAALLIENLTYRDIGQRLYISPKTVEHHVARIKQRVGATQRSEMLQELRGLLDTPSDRR